MMIGTGLLMTLETLGQDPLEMLVEQALRRLSEGEPPSRIEVERVDVKEEPGRRGAGGAVSPGKRENEQAASYLAEEMACMANTPGGVAPDNIITHPAVPRYRSLAEAMAKLGLAEREGIGVDRMVRDMLAIGRPPPAISQLDGPYVRVALLGGSPDAAVAALVAALTPSRAANVDSLLLIEHLARHGWVDAESAAPVLQRSSSIEAGEAIHRLAEVHLDPDHSAPVITPVRGVPASRPDAFRLSDTARRRLSHRLASLRNREGREAMILQWSRARGRVSSTEVADLTGLSKVSAGKLLTALADAGHLEGSRPERIGRGFFYVPANSGERLRNVTGTR